MKKFEYKVEKVPKIKNFKELIDFLNYYGDDGWELCVMSEEDFLLKREIKI